MTSHPEREARSIDSSEHRHERWWGGRTAFAPSAPNEMHGGLRRASARLARSVRAERVDHGAPGAAELLRARDLDAHHLALTGLELGKTTLRADWKDGTARTFTVVGKPR